MYTIVNLKQQQQLAHLCQRAGPVAKTEESENREGIEERIFCQVLLWAYEFVF